MSRGFPPPPPGAYPQHNHHPETIFVNAPGRDTSVTRLTVPLLIVISTAIFLVSATYAATSQFADIKHSIDKLAGKIESMTGELAGRINRLEQDGERRDRDGWTKRDQEVWCAKAERANQATGWTCSGEKPDVARFAPQVNGWAARAKQ